MKEIVRSGIKSVEAQIGELSTEELFGQLSKENQNLAALGVKNAISKFAHHASMYGNLYEDRRNDKGTSPTIRPTPMNFFMALVSLEPELLDLPEDRFQELGGVVSRIAMVTDVLYKKEGWFEWPEKLTESPSPKKQLSPKQASTFVWLY